MRLFIAINFNQQTKNNINEIIERLEKYAIQGRFVKKEHMHLTLEFLGEVSLTKVASVISAMELINSTPFILTLSDLGYFKRIDGNVYWLGISENRGLMDTQGELHNSLLRKGFLLQQREYRPHITIGRRVKLSNSFDSEELRDTISKIEIQVNSIDLMKSERINGKLIHECIYSKPLL